METKYWYHTRIELIPNSQIDLSRAAIFEAPCNDDLTK